MLFRQRESPGLDFRVDVEVANLGDAREESYYSSLEDLFKTYAGAVSRSKVHITTLPKKTDAGNPDFRIWDGKQNIVGYIEAKQPTEDGFGGFLAQGIIVACSFEIR